jgi:GNAT superfamily N-acetyltransferase
MEIRIVDVADAPRLVPLFTDLGHPSTEEQLVRRLTRLAGDPTYAAWVGEADGELLAFAAGHLLHLVENDDPAAQLIALVVANEQQGRGLGKQMVDTFENWARELGAGRLAVTSNRRRTEAHAFYEGRGYDRTGFRFAKLGRG